MVYPFGALVFFKKAAGFDRGDKWSDRLAPALLTGVSHGPGMQWDRTDFVVPLEEGVQGEGPASQRHRLPGGGALPSEGVLGAAQLGARRVDAGPLSSGGWGQLGPCHRRGRP